LEIENDDQVESAGVRFIENGDGNQAISMSLEQLQKLAAGRNPGLLKIRG